MTENINEIMDKKELLGWVEDDEVYYCPHCDAEALRNRWGRQILSPFCAECGEQITEKKLKF